MSGTPFPSQYQQPLQALRPQAGYNSQALASSGGYPMGGPFHGAQNFVIRDSTLQCFTTTSNEPSAFKIKKYLARHTLRGAEFDSSERHPPPTCHPDTRTIILHNVRSWRYNEIRTERILWLNGPAGVGKSSIVQTLAQDEARLPNSLLGATLFFSRPHKRNNPKLIFNTIAYRLTVNNPPYQSYIWERVSADPKLPETSLSNQFLWYIEIPFGQRQLYRGPGSLSIYVDALDECKGEEAQKEIIQLIGQFVRKYPAAPLVWIVSSRQEPHLEIGFEGLGQSCREVEVPIAEPESLADVEKVLRYRFAVIREAYPDHMPKRSHWPSDPQFSKIVRRAAGMFAFAETVVRFVDNPHVGDPISQLDRIIASLDRSESIAMANGTFPDVFATLDDLYKDILSDIHEGIWPHTRRLLAYSLNGDKFSFLSVCNLLGLKQNEGYAALHKLHSVVNVPKWADAADRHLHFYHTSFSDYLQDSTRSGNFSITQDWADAIIWEGNFRILREVDNSDSKRTHVISLTWDYDESELDCQSQQALYYDAKTSWAMDFSYWCKRRSEGEFPLDISLVLEALNAVNYGNLQRWMPITEMREFLRSVKALSAEIETIPVQRIGIKDIEFQAMVLGDVAYATCEAFGPLKQRNEFPEWVEQHVGSPPNPDVEGPLRHGNCWYYALGVFKRNSMQKIWKDLKTHRNSSLDAFIFGSSGRSCLFIEFETPNVETWSYVIPYDPFG